MAEPNEPLTKAEREELLRFDRDLSESGYREKIARWEATVAKLEGVLGRIANHRHASAIDPGGDATLLEVVERIERWALDALYPKRHEPKPEPPKPEPPKPEPPKPEPELPKQTSIACIHEAHDQCDGQCIPWRATRKKPLIRGEPVEITTGAPRPCQCSCHKHVEK